LFMFLLLVGRGSRTLVTRRPVPHRPASQGAMSARPKQSDFR
jgi:hypothetical protein